MDVLKKEVEKDPKAATQMIMNRHKRSDVILQLTEVMESFKKTDIEVKADTKASTDEVKKEGEPEGNKVEMEGGGGEENKDAKGDEVKGDAMATTDPRKGHSDEAEYKGFAETPALYLRNALVNEYFGDLIKQRIVAIQFMGEKGLDTNKELAGAAGYLTSGLATTAEKPATEAWFSGLVGELDEAAYSELKKDGAISFPGWV